MGVSCRKHIAIRFAKSFKFAMYMYLPLQLLVKMRRPSIKAIQLATVDAIRSSVFLGAFISLFYGSVCLWRTTLGPKLLRESMIREQVLDSGLAVGFPSIPEWYS